MDLGNVYLQMGEAQGTEGLLGCVCVLSLKREVKTGPPESPKIGTFLLEKNGGSWGNLRPWRTLFLLTANQLFQPFRFTLALGFSMHLSALVFSPRFATWFSPRLA